MQIINAEKFGKLVRSTRKTLKITQTEVAAACGVGERFIRELEKGKPSCQLGKALMIVQMLGIKLDATLPPKNE